MDILVLPQHSSQDTTAHIATLSCLIKKIYDQS